MGFISLVDEIQLMLISSHHICIRSIGFRFLNDLSDVFPKSGATLVIPGIQEHRQVVEKDKFVFISPYVFIKCNMSECLEETGR